MESVRCPRCGTVTFKEKGKCPRCHYDFSRISAKPQLVTPRVIFVAREGVPQAVKKASVTVDKALESIIETIALGLRRTWGFIKKSFMLTALFVGRAVEALANTLFTPVLYLMEITAKSVAVISSVFVKSLATSLIAVAKFGEGVRSIPDLFRRGRKRFLPRVGQAVEAKPVTMVTFAKTSDQGVALQKPPIVSQVSKSAPIFDPAKSVAIKVAPPIARPFPTALVREPVPLKGVDVMPAGILSRLLAGVIDISIILLTVGILLVPAWLAGSFSFLTLAPDKFAKVSLTVYLFVIAIAGIYLIVSMSVYGKTFGKKLFGLKVIKISGEPLNLYDSFVRFSAWLISGLFFGLGWLWLVFDLNHRSLHDYLCQTVVIRDAS